jgi:hypothetical protein
MEELKGWQNELEEGTEKYLQQQKESLLEELETYLQQQKKELEELLKG